jgi:3-hydroxybutyryl-CoA dehydrogenase
MLRTIGIVGCGLMGTGIAEVAAAAGLSVVAVKATPGSLDAARARIEGSLARAVARGKRTDEERTLAMARITFSANLDALGGCDLIIESCPEVLGAKKELLARLEQVARRDALLATNTSSLPLPELARALEHPQRFLGLHFFSPVAAMDLVEVGRIARTEPAAIDAAVAFVHALGKTPIVLDAEVGYLVNRLLVPQLCQAIEMLEGGVARASDIDLALKKGLGHPMGPLALADAIGLDVVLAMAQTMAHELRDRRFRVPRLLRRLVQAGHLGKKTKMGLYDHAATGAGTELVENPEVALGRLPHVAAPAA